MKLTLDEKIVEGAIDTLKLKIDQNSIYGEGNRLALNGDLSLIVPLTLRAKKELSQFDLNGMKKDIGESGFIDENIPHYQIVFDENLNEIEFRYIRNCLNILQTSQTILYFQKRIDELDLIELLRKRKYYSKKK